VTDKDVISAVARALTQYIKLHPCEDDCNVQTMECQARRDALDALDKVLHYSLIGPREECDACPDCGPVALCGKHSRISEAEDAPSESGRKK
jgi:hypothetical protein